MRRCFAVAAPMTTLLMATGCSADETAGTTGEGTSAAAEESAPTAATRNRAIRPSHVASAEACESPDSELLHEHSISFQATRAPSGAPSLSSVGAGAILRSRSA